MKSILIFGVAILALGFYIDSRKTPELIRLERVIADVVNAYEEKTGVKIDVNISKMSFISWSKVPFTIDKKMIYVCTEKFDSFDSLIFVTLHELAHVVTEEIGHTALFWDNFRTLLDIATDRGHIKRHVPSSKVCGVRVGPKP